MTEANDPLRRLVEVARKLGADELAVEAAETAMRLEASRFYVACVGQFKRGKSTLINALIGTPILPTGVVPVTNLITVVCFGGERGASVRFLDGSEQEIALPAIVEYVSEERNRTNQKRVAMVEVRVDAPLLASGMCLVDTPGLGSVFSESSEMTRRFVPQIDVALLVIGADPPLSGEELLLAETIGGETPHLLVALNKADRIAAVDVEQAATFARVTLEARLKRPIELFVVSAIERSRDWNALDHRLDELARAAGGELVRAALDRAMLRFGAAISQEIEEHRRALLAPLEETERKLAQIQRRVAAAQRALDDLTFLFASEQQKLSRRFEAARDRFLSGAETAAETDEHARRIAQGAIEAWLREIEPEAQRMFAAATERFAQLLHGLGAPDDLEGHLSRRRFYFTALPDLSGRGWFRRRDPSGYLRRLLETNSARVMNDLIDRVVESRRRIERDVAMCLRQILAAAQRVAQHARAIQEKGREQVAEEIVHLDALAEELEGRS